MNHLAALGVLLDGATVSDEERAYYASLEDSDEGEPTSYNETLGLDDYDVLNDR